MANFFAMLPTSCFDPRGKIVQCARRKMYGLPLVNRRENRRSLQIGPFDRHHQVPRPFGPDEHDARSMRSSEDDLLADPRMNRKRDPRVGPRGNLCSEPCLMVGALAA
jgi:hypothetical protein